MRVVSVGIFVLLLGCTVSSNNPRDAAQGQVDASTDARLGSPDAQSPDARPRTLAGVGWTGSTSYDDYPQTGTVSDGGVVVNIDDGLDGKSPEARLLDALALLNTEQRVLIRNDTNQTVTLTAPIVRSTAWTSRRQFFAYGSQRIHLDMSQLRNVDPLLFSGAAEEHWKGFEITGTTAAIDAAVMIVSSTRVQIEDFYIHHNPSGKPVRINSGSDILVQDSVTWHNGTLGISHTDVPDGMAASQFSQRARFVRNVTINPNDDGLDLWSAKDSAIIDCVVIGAGKYWDGSIAGDGNGIKMGGEPTALGGNWATGSIAVGNRLVGIHWNWQAGAPLRLEQLTATGGNQGMVVGPGEHIVRRVISYGNGSTAGNTNGGQDNIEASNVSGNCWNMSSPCANPRFADPANGDFSLLEGSPYIHAGPNGETLGASEIALELLHTHWARR